MTWTSGFAVNDYLETLLRTGLIRFFSAEFAMLAVLGHVIIKSDQRASFHRHFRISFGLNDVRGSAGGSRDLGRSRARLLQRAPPSASYVPNVESSRILQGSSDDSR